MTSNPLSRSLLVALLPWTLGGIAPAQAKPAPPAEERPGYAAALARYKECLSRLPFRFHTDGRERLAQTREPEAFRILSEDYAKPADYPEYTRYTLGTLFGRHFNRAEFVDGLDALRKASNKPVDTWLWVKALRIKVDQVGDAEAIEIAQTDKNVLHRAAAIAAIGESRNGNLKAVVLPTCADFPKKEYERYMVLGAMSGALLDNKRRVNDAEYRDALTAYIGLLADEVDLPHTAKVQVARHLQLILGGPALFINQQPWLDMLKGGDVKPPEQKGHTVVAPRFFGIETEGERFCYVIDMSDSMLMEISPSAKPLEAGGVVTGPRQPPKKKKRELLDENDLPWDKIKNRWDLAREHLKIALLRLTPDKHFAIVWFGDESGTLDSCKGMIKATKGNVDRVVAELDSIKPMDLPPQVDGHTKRKGIGPEKKVLRGNTNMHSGLRRAFGLAGRGFVDEFAYVDPEALTEGCDTIFLLSDGAPTMDDFYILDKDYGEGGVIEDQETATPALTRQPRIWYPGPYREDDWLVEDTRRMNAFRRIRLHCIGLGEANESLMKRLADMGNGESFFFGKKKAEAAEGGKK